MNATRPKLRLADVAASAVAFVALMSAWLPGNVASAWLGLPVGVACVAYLGIRGRTVPTAYDLAVVLFVIGLVAGAMVSPLKEPALAALRTYLAVVAGFYLTVAQPRMWTPIVIAVLVAGCIVGVLLLFYLWTAPIPLGARLDVHKITPVNEWFFDAIHSISSPRWSLPAETASPNTAAVPLVTLLALTWTATLRSRRGHLALALAASAIAMFLLIMTGSRSGWLAGAGVLAAASLVTGKGRSLAVSVFALAALVVLVIAGDRTALLLDLETLLGRERLWAATLPGILAALPWGIGLGTFPYYITALLGHGSNPHNAAIQLLGETGVLGLTAFLVAAFVVVRTVRDTRPLSAIGQGAFVALLGYAVVSAFESTVAMTVRTAAGSYEQIAVPLPWLLVGVLERERLARLT